MNTVWISLYFPIFVTLTIHNYRDSVNMRNETVLPVPETWGAKFITGFHGIAKSCTPKTGNGHPYLKGFIEAEENCITLNSFVGTGSIMMRRLPALISHYFAKSMELSIREYAGTSAEFFSIYFVKFLKSPGISPSATSTAKND